MRTFNVGHISSTAAIPLLVCDHLGLLEQSGWKLQLMHHVGWQSLANRLFDGELDAAIVHPSMLIAKAAESAGNNISCTGCFSMGMGGDALVGRFPSQQFISYLEEKGEVRFGTSGPHFPDLCVINDWIQGAFKDPSKVRLVEVPIPVTQTLQLVSEGFVDLYLSHQPWIKTAQVQGIGYPVTQTGGLMGCEVTRVLAVKNNILRANETFYSEFLENLSIAVRWIADPSSRKELLAVLRSENWALSDEELMDIFEADQITETSTITQRFENEGRRGVALLPEDVKPAWQFYRRSHPKDKSLEIPAWIDALFRIG